MLPNEANYRYGTDDRPSPSTPSTPNRGGGAVRVRFRRARLVVSLPRPGRPVRHPRAMLALRRPLLLPRLRCASRLSPMTAPLPVEHLPVLERFACAVGEHRWLHLDESEVPGDAEFEFRYPCCQRCACGACGWTAAPSPLHIVDQPTWNGKHHRWPGHGCNHHAPPPARCGRCDAECDCVGCFWNQRSLDLQVSV